MSSISRIETFFQNVVPRSIPEKLTAIAAIVRMIVQPTFSTLLFCSAGYAFVNYVSGGGTAPDSEAAPPMPPRTAIVTSIDSTGSLIFNAVRQNLNSFDLE